MGYFIKGVFHLSRCKKGVLLFLFGFFSYSIIEILWRRYTHWTMSITGGACFVLLHSLFHKLQPARLWKKCVAGGLSITGVEFAVGCIVNLWLRWDVWDYSQKPFNLLGQICPLYTLLWGLLCIPIAAVVHFLDIHLFHAPPPLSSGCGKVLRFPQITKKPAAGFPETGAPGQTG